ncbi:MAG: 50S ribosomal protein L3 [Candidatus Omnitrophota bacterium]
MIREIFGKKIGMTQVFDKDGSLIGVTLVEIEPVCILETVSYATKPRVRIGCFKCDERKVKKPLLGYFKKVGASPYRMVREVLIDEKASEGVKQEVVSAEQGKNQESTSAQSQEKSPAISLPEVGIEMFNEGDMVSVRGRTKGKGFTGGMKRHGWHGGPGAHGSMFHRRIGSNGANTDPGRVVRGHPMPGHCGDVIRIMKNLKVFRVDKEKKVLFIQGSIPGSRGGIVSVEKLSKQAK